MERVDLHTHSTCSDGTYTPTELVLYAAQKGLSSIALTDHDTFSGYQEAYHKGLEVGVEVIGGIEFSTEYEKKDVHILGLLMDFNSDRIKNELSKFVRSRELRNEKMCLKLQEHNIPITMQDLENKYPDAVITRSHFADWMLEHDFIKSKKEAFDIYIGDQCPCFIGREKVTPTDAIQLIHKCGGLAALAHPTLYHMSDSSLDHLVRELKENGLDAIEVEYSTYSPVEEKKMKKLARKYGLLFSGGSDFHGNAKPGLDLATGYGNLSISKTFLDKMKEYKKMKQRIFFSDLDGTLLTTEKTLSKKTREVIYEILDRSHVLVLSSGRPLNSIQDVKASLDLPDKNIYLAGYNGGILYSCETGEVLFEKMIPYDFIEPVFQLAEKFKIHCQTYSDTHIVSKRGSKELEHYQRTVKVPHIYTEDIVGALSHPPFKILAISLEGKSHLQQLKDSLESDYNDKLTSFFSNEHLLEIVPADSGKGKVIPFLTDYLNVERSFTIAAGDEENDISMFREAGVSIAMKNGNPSLFQEADFVTAGDNDHDGLVPYLRDFFQL